MRDTIADIITDITYVYPWNAEATADAIVAAMPGMVAPLVWETAYYNKVANSLGFAYSLEQSHGQCSVAVFGKADLFKVLYRGASEAKAIEAANKHYVDAIMAAFKPKEST
jgi:hypothetical protein